MSKVLAVLIAGLFAAGAYAQEKSQEAAPVTSSAPQAKAQMKVEAKPAGKAATAPADQAKSQESTPTPSGKAVVAGEKRHQTRDMRRRNKDGSIKRKTTQGVTPQDKGAK